MRKSHSCHSSSSLTKSPINSGNLSRVSLSYTLVSLRLFRDELEKKGREVMHCIRAAATSLSFPDLANKIEFALVYTSGVRVKPSIRTLTLGMRNSFREEVLLTALIWTLSILITKLESMQICTLKSCYHKLRKFKVNIPVYNHILILILLFHLQLLFFQASIILPVFFWISACLIFFLLISALLFWHISSRHPFNRSTNSRELSIFYFVMLTESTTISYSTLFSIIISWTWYFLSRIVSNCCFI